MFSFDKKLREQKLLRFLQELIWCNLVSEILNQNVIPNGSFWFFLQLTNIYYKITLLIDEEYISQEASYTAQQNSREINSLKD